MIPLRPCVHRRTRRVFGHLFGQGVTGRGTVATLSSMTDSGTAIAQLPTQPRCALRPVVVAANLGGLHGPVSGRIELPQRLFWSGPGRVFDLDDEDQALEMYEAVFEAARCEDDLAGHLNGELLARLWPELALAPRIRRAWEAAHPLLAHPLLTIA